MPAKKTDKFETADDVDGTGVQCQGCGHRWPEDDVVDGYCGYCQCEEWERRTAALCSKETSR
jgi:hypothetical protein